MPLIQKSAGGVAGRRRCIGTSRFRAASPTLAHSRGRIRARAADAAGPRVLQWTSSGSGRGAAEGCPFSRAAEAPAGPAADAGFPDATSPEDGVS